MLVVKNAITMPISQTTCERSFSKVKIIKNYLRNWMSGARLSDLTILAIERDISIDYEQIVDKGSLINHILLGKHHRTVERFSLKDTAMKVYHCKLEEVGNRQMISIDLNLRGPIESQPICLSKGWALPIRKPRKGFSPKQREYLETKFNDGVSGKMH